MPLGKSEKQEELSTWLERTRVGNADRDQDGSDEKRERMEAISLNSKSDPHSAVIQSCFLLAPVLTAAVTGTAGISIPGIMGGTIPGIYGYKDKNQLQRWGQAQAWQGPKRFCCVHDLHMGTSSGNPLRDYGLLA